MGSCGPIVCDVFYHSCVPIIGYSYNLVVGDGISYRALGIVLCIVSSVWCGCLSHIYYWCQLEKSIWLPSGWKKHSRRVITLLVMSSSVDLRCVTLRRVLRLINVYTPFRLLVVPIDISPVVRSAMVFEE